MKEIQIQFSSHIQMLNFLLTRLELQVKQEINIVESDILSVFLSHSARIFVYVTNADSEM